LYRYTLERVAAMNEVYGEDVMLLIGGSLMGHSPDLAANSKHFMAIAGRKDLYGYGGPSFSRLKRTQNIIRFFCQIKKIQPQETPSLPD
jgi:hypothetical protein